MKTLAFIALIGLILVTAANLLRTNDHGNWVSDNGATLYADADGKAGFRIGNKKVIGGSAVIDEEAKTLTISLFGLGETWKIDLEPSDQGEMKLDSRDCRI